MAFYISRTTRTIAALGLPGLPPLEDRLIFVVGTPHLAMKMQTGERRLPWSGSDELTTYNLVSSLSGRQLISLLV